MWQAGVKNIVATCGTSLTETHARLMKRMTEDVILLFDGDIAGKRSAVRAGGPLYAAGISPLVLFPPKGLDPDDWAKESSPGELSDRIARAIPLMEYIERAAARKYDLSQISGKLSYLQLMGKYLPWITDPAEERMYVQRVAKAAALPEETVLERLRGRKTAAAPAAPGMPPRASSSRPEEDMLLGLLSMDPSLIEDIRRDGVESLLEGEGARDVVARLGRLSSSGKSPDILSVLSEAEGEEVRKTLSEQMLRADASPGEARRIYPEVVTGLRIRKARNDLVRLRDEIHAAKGETAQALFTKMLEVRNKLEELEKQRRTRR